MEEAIPGAIAASSFVIALIGFFAVRKQAASRKMNDAPVTDGGGYTVGDSPPVVSGGSVGIDDGTVLAYTGIAGVAVPMSEEQRNWRPSGTKFNFGKARSVGNENGDPVS